MIILVLVAAICSIAGYLIGSRERRRHLRATRPRIVLKPELPVYWHIIDLETEARSSVEIVTDQHRSSGKEPVADPSVQMSSGL